MEQINKKLLVNAELYELDVVISFLEEMLEEAGCPIKTMTQISISVEEIFVNIANYAYPETGGDCELDMTVDGNRMILCISDEGEEFNPLEKEDPDITLSAEERQIGGLGIWMVKQSMDSVEYCYEENKNKITLIKSWE